MTGLLVKDWHLMMQRKQNLLIFLAVCLIMSSATADGSFIVGYMLFLGGMMAMSTISYDEADNGLTFLFTLPIDRKTYVLSKYVLTVLAGAAFWAVSIVLMFLVNMVKGVAFEPLEELANALAVLPVMLIIMDIMLPLKLKFGMEKSRVVSALLFGCIFAVVMAAGQVEAVQSGVHAGVAFLDGVSGLQFAAAAFVLFLAATVVSVQIAIRIMENKAL